MAELENELDVFDKPFEPTEEWYRTDERELWLPYLTEMPKYWEHNRTQFTPEHRQAFVDAVSDAAFDIYRKWESKVYMEREEPLEGSPEEEQYMEERDRFYAQLAAIEDFDPRTIPGNERFPFSSLLEPDFSQRFPEYAEYRARTEEEPQADDVPHEFPTSSEEEAYVAEATGRLSGLMSVDLHRKTAPVESDVQPEKPAPEKPVEKGHLERNNWAYEGDAPEADDQQLGYPGHD